MRVTIGRSALHAGLAGLLVLGCMSAPDVPETPTPDPTSSATASPVQASPLLGAFTYLDNVLLRATAGEWDLHTGLDTSLRALVGAATLQQVTQQRNLASQDVTGLLDTSRRYLERDDLTDLQRDSINNSLRFLLLDRQRLEAMAVDPSQPLPTAPNVTPPPVLGPDETHLEEPFFDPSSPAYENDCELFFRRFPLGPGTTTCLVARNAEAAGMSYGVYAPAPSIAPFHWTDADHALLDEAVAETLPTYLELGSMPAFDVVLGVNLDAPGETASLVNDDGCVIWLYTQAQHRPEALFKQLVARQLAHCLQAETFPEQEQVPYADRRWRQEGLATYLSSLVYPAANLELESLPTVQAIADTTSVFDWSAGTFVWFQHLANQLGTEQLFDLLRALPASASREEQQAALADWPTMDALFHEFAQAYTDGTISSPNGERIPTQWTPEVNSATLLDAVGNHAALEVAPFSMSRQMVIVPRDRRASIESGGQANGPLTSSRSYSGTSWGPLPEVFPERCLDDNRLVLVSTVTGSEAQSSSVEVLSFDTSCG